MMVGRRSVGHKLQTNGPCVEKGTSSDALKFSDYVFECFLVFFFETQTELANFPNFCAKFAQYAKLCQN